MVQRPGQDSRKPVIGVTGNDDWFSPSWLCIRLAVLMAGGQPRRISVSRELETSDLDALVVSGGDDIHPTLYDEEPDPAVFYDTARDEMEERYISIALDRGIPLLGICRGYQLINVLLGGSLFLDIRELRSLTRNRRGLLATKRVRITPGSLLSDVMGTEQTGVNSLHFQAINKVADGLETVAWDRDGIIQAVVSENRSVIGVQWHPEYLFYLKAHRSLFRWLVEQARKSMN